MKWSGQKGVLRRASLLMNEAPTIDGAESTRAAVKGGCPAQLLIKKQPLSLAHLPRCVPLSGVWGPPELPISFRKHSRGIRNWTARRLELLVCSQGEPF